MVLLVHVIGLSMIKTESASQRVIGMIHRGHILGEFKVLAFCYWDGCTVLLRVWLEGWGRDSINMLTSLNTCYTSHVSCAFVESLNYICLPIWGACILAS